MNVPDGPTACIFDLDGTVLDTLSDIASSANHALRVHGLDPHMLSDFRAFVGDGARMLLSRASAGASGQKLDRLEATFVAHYADHAAEQSQYFAGFEQLLERLTVKPVLCTNKPRGPSETLFRKLGMGRYFTDLVAGDDLEHKKPHPAMIAKSVEVLGVPSHRCVVVGDGPQDVGAGRAAGAATVAVTWGFGTAERLREAAPDYVVDTVEALAECLLMLGAIEPTP